jgi:hypothetical protein
MVKPESLSEIASALILERSDGRELLAQVGIRHFRGVKQLWLLGRGIINHSRIAIYCRNLICDLRLVNREGQLGG